MNAAHALRLDMLLAPSSAHDRATPLLLPQACGIPALVYRTSCPPPLPATDAHATSTHCFTGWRGRRAAPPLPPPRRRPGSRSQLQSRPPRSCPNPTHPRRPCVCVCVCVHSRECCRCPHACVFLILQERVIINGGADVQLGAGAAVAGALSLRSRFLHHRCVAEPSVATTYVRSLLVRAGGSGPSAHGASSLEAAPLPPPLPPVPHHGADHLCDAGFTLRARGPTDCDETFNYWEPVRRHPQLRPRP